MLNVQAPHPNLSRRDTDRQPGEASRIKAVHPLQIYCPTKKCIFFRHRSI